MEQTIVSMKSMYENANNADDICLFFINMGIEDNSRIELIKLVEEYNSKIKIIEFADIAYDLNISSETGRHIKSVYAKLFFGRIVDLERIIYLDSDVIVKGDIEELWNIGLGENVCAGVETIHTREDNALIGYGIDDRAINDGVVLMDLKKWREGLYLEKCLKYINDHDGNPPVLSEGTINAVCKGNIKIINPKYNLISGLVMANADKICRLTQRPYYSQTEIDEANRVPIIIHYLSGYYNRPWCSECTHPCKEEYLKYRNMTRYRDQPLSDKRLPIRLKMIGFLIRILPPEWIRFLRKVTKYRIRTL